MFKAVEDGMCMYIGYIQGCKAGLSRIISNQAKGHRPVQPTARLHFFSQLQQVHVPPTLNHRHSI